MKKPPIFSPSAIIQALHFWWIISFFRHLEHRTFCFLQSVSPFFLQYCAASCSEDITGYMTESVILTTLLYLLPALPAGWRTPALWMLLTQSPESVGIWFCSLYSLSLQQLYFLRHRNGFHCFFPHWRSQPESSFSILLFFPSIQDVFSRWHLHRLADGVVLHRPDPWSAEPDCQSFHISQKRWLPQW